MSKQIASRPTRARGLKHGYEEVRNPLRKVAPHAGAWIETISPVWYGVPLTVAPHAGAWIETKEK